MDLVLNDLVARAGDAVTPADVANFGPLLLADQLRVAKHSDTSARSLRVYLFCSVIVLAEERETAQDTKSESRTRLSFFRGKKQPSPAPARVSSLAVLGRVHLRDISRAFPHDGCDPSTRAERPALTLEMRRTDLPTIVLFFVDTTQRDSWYAIVDSKTRPVELPSLSPPPSPCPSSHPSYRASIASSGSSGASSVSSAPSSSRFSRGKQTRLGAMPPPLSPLPALPDEASETSATPKSSLWPPEPSTHTDDPGAEPLTLDIRLDDSVTETSEPPSSPSFVYTSNSVHEGIPRGREVRIGGLDAYLVAPQRRRRTSMSVPPSPTVPSSPSLSGTITSARDHVAEGVEGIENSYTFRRTSSTRGGTRSTFVPALASASSLSLSDGMSSHSSQSDRPTRSSGTSSTVRVILIVSDMLGWRFKNLRCIADQMADNNVSFVLLLCPSILPG
jgi:hypothetical protein